MTFTEHCSAQGVVPGATLVSVVDGASFYVDAVLEGDSFFPDRVRTSPHDGAGRRAYYIHADELHEFSVQR